MQLRNRLAELMAEHHVKTGERLTQTKLAEATGIAQSTISAYVNNSVTQYHADTVLRFLVFFGVGLSDFLFVCENESESEQGHRVAVALAG
ncbi:MAG: helix-turn-helix transcriptional regulator [Anaerolineae bacterium]|nr:helix-turn-helix transcriptional regulator [Anaerolineae bacterium]